MPRRAFVQICCVPSAKKNIALPSINVTVQKWISTRAGRTKERKNHFLFGKRPKIMNHHHPAKRGKGETTITTTITTQATTTRATTITTRVTTTMTTIIITTTITTQATTTRATTITTTITTMTR